MTVFCVAIDFGKNFNKVNRDRTFITTYGDGRENTQKHFHCE